MVESIMRPGSHPDLFGEDAAAPIGLTGMGLLPQVQAKLAPEQGSSPKSLTQAEDGRSYNLSFNLVVCSHSDVALSCGGMWRSMVI